MADSVTILGSATAADVNVASALPSGDNNIGNVDLASPIPAGANSLGTVGLDAGANSIGSVRPEALNENTLADVGVSRGLPGKRTNVIENSEDFAAGTWAAQQVTVTSNVAKSPFGSVNADRVADNGVNDTHGIYRNGGITPNAPVYTLSVYAKRETLDFIILDTWTGSDEASQYFDLANEKLGGAYADPTPTAALNVESARIYPVKDGWVRCVATFRYTGTGLDFNYQIGLSEVDADAVAWSNSYVGTGKSVLLSGAQMEAGAFESPYIKTGASPVERDFAETRLGDVNLVPEAKVTLASGLPNHAGARTNLLEYSEQLDQSGSWTKFSANTSIVINGTQGPTGRNSVDQIAETANTDRFGVTQTLAGVAQDGLFSIQAKVKVQQRHWVMFEYRSGSNFAQQYFDVRRGVVGGAWSAANEVKVDSASMEPIGRGFYLCKMVVRRAGASTSPVIGFYTATGDNSSATATTHLGVAGAGIWVTDTQAEEADFPGPYIETGAAATSSGSDSIGKLGATNTGVDIGSVGLLSGAEAVGFVGVQPSQKITMERTIAGSRTNLIKYSEDLSNATGWATWEVTLTANNALSPFGDVTAEKIVTNSTNDAHGIYTETASEFTITAGQPFVASMYIKDDTSGWVGLDIGEDTLTDAATAYFDITNGQVGNIVTKSGSKLYVVDAGIERASNGYWRCWAVFNSDTGVLTSMDMSCIIPNGNPTSSGWEATHTVSGLGLWVTGMQVEDNATYPGPYIKNLAGTTTTAGSDVLGDVDVTNTSFGLDAGENYVGQVGGQTVHVDVAVVPSTATYTAGDAVQGFQTFSDILRVNGGSGRIKSLTMIDIQGNDSEYDLVFFSGAPTGTIADQDLYALDTSNDILKVIGVVHVATADWIQLGTPSMVTKPDVGLGVKNSSNTRHIYMAIVDRTGTTYAASGKLQFRVVVEQN